MHSGIIAPEKVERDSKTWIPSQFNEPDTG